MRHSDREQKKTLRWAFLTLASWKAKVVMSGMVDIMEQCWETKAQLEAERLSLDQVAHTENRSRPICQPPGCLGDPTPELCYIFPIPFV